MVYMEWCDNLKVQEGIGGEKFLSKDCSRKERKEKISLESSSAPGAECMLMQIFGIELTKSTLSSQQYYLQTYV